MSKALTRGLVVIGLAAACGALAFSCRARDGSSLFGEDDVDEGKGKISIDRAANSKTRYEVRFYASEGVAENQQLQVQWGVVSNYSDTPVDCSQLEKAAKVTYKTYAGKTERKLGGFDLEVKEDEFKKCADADPKGLRKISLECMKSGDWHGPMRLEGCVTTADGTVVGKGWGYPKADGEILEGFGLADQIPDVNAVVNYGKICAQKLGKLPAFDCRDGQVIPITLGGTEVPFGQHTSDMKCDRPVYLGLGSDGQCVPYARLGRLKTDNPDVDTVFICRRYKIADAGQPRAAETPLHEDVAIVSHNRKTGESCWYQALSGFQPGERSLATTRVPPPDEEELPDDVKLKNETLAPLDRAMRADEFWIKPDQSRNFACIKCHDSDPFMLSPYVAQVTVEKNGVKEYLLPCDPAKPGQVPKPLCRNEGASGKYSMVSKRHNPPSWPKTVFVAPKDPGSRECLSCHRIGSINTCNTWALDSMGRAAPLSARSQLQKSDFLRTFPANHWMPVSPNAQPHTYASADSWDNDFKKSADATAECCKLFAGLPQSQAAFDAKCEQSPISTPPPEDGNPAGNNVVMTSATGVVIPDNSPAGVSVPLNLTTGTLTGVVKSMVANIDVKHPFIGQVKVELEHAGQTTVLYDGFQAEIPAEANLKTTVRSGIDGSPLAVFIGTPAEGTWSVKVSDNGKHEKGKLDSFELNLTVGE